MSARPTPSKGGTKGNFIAEWFGHRVWPRVDASSAAVYNQSGRLCPFISIATGLERQCIKSGRGYDEPVGVCTISSDSNGLRQDWLACPYRTLDQHFTLLNTAIRTAFKIPHSTAILSFPVSALLKEEVHSQIKNSLKTKECRVFIFSADKLGGEVDIPETNMSPGAKVDMSVIELIGLGIPSKTPPTFGRHIFYEIQTADFHGSPLHAATLLKQACPSGSRDEFHRSLIGAEELCGTGVEGPNKANIFKRTIYQMLFKIELSMEDNSAGFVIVLPEPVWESWLRHLGRPVTINDPGQPNLSYLLAPGQDYTQFSTKIPASIIIFDIDRDSLESPQPLKVLKTVATNSLSLIHYAFSVASQKALEQQVIRRYRDALTQRIIAGWHHILPEEEGR